LQNIGSRTGSWRRLVAVPSIVILALAYFGPSTALAVGVAPTITSAAETYFHTGVLTTFTVTTTGSPGIALTESGALPAGLTFTDNGDGTATLSGTALPGQEGDHDITITATNAVGHVDQPFTIEVGTVSPPVVTSAVFSAIEGVSFTAPVGSFTGGLGPFSAHIVWGDGATTDIASATSPVSATHLYAEEGSMNVTLSITAAGTPPTQSSTLAETVADAILNNCDCVPPTITANEGAAFSGVVGSFQDNDPGRTASDYTANIAWGDTTTSVGTIVALESGFNVTGTHTYDEHGSYSGAIAIADTGGATTGDTFNATIGEVSPLVVTGKNITATAGVSFTTQVATFTDPCCKEATSDYNVRINWGDATATDLTGTVGDPPGVLTVTGTHTYAAIGTYTITIGAEEADGQVFDIGTGSATVTALPLTSAPSRPQPLGLLIATFSLLLAITGVVAWRRRPTRAPIIRAN
jgi:hypothetical protein